MADLIDRAALIKKLDLLARHEDAFRQTVINGVIFTIEQERAVDAVEVVRCKDCKRNEKNGGDCNRTLTITERDYVLELNVSKYITLDFCSYGERKET